MIDYDVLSKEISAYRRDLHKIPELGFFVYKTNAYVKAVLDGLDCQVETV